MQTVRARLVVGSWNVYCRREPGLLSCEIDLHCWFPFLAEWLDSFALLFDFIIAQTIRGSKCHNYGHPNWWYDIIFLHSIWNWSGANYAYAKWVRYANRHAWLRVFWLAKYVKVYLPHSCIYVLVIVDDAAPTCATDCAQTGNVQLSHYPYPSGYVLSKQLGSSVYCLLSSLGMTLIKIGDKNCTNVYLVVPGVLACTMPQGAGTGMRWSIDLAGQIAIGPTFKYNAPAITGFPEVFLELSSFLRVTFLLGIHYCWIVFESEREQLWAWRLLIEFRDFNGNLCCFPELSEWVWSFHLHRYVVFRAGCFPMTFFSDVGIPMTHHNLTCRIPDGFNGNGGSAEVRLFVYGQDCSQSFTFAVWLFFGWEALRVFAY